MNRNNIQGISLRHSPAALSPHNGLIAVINFDDSETPIEELVHERTIARNMFLLADSLQNFWNNSNPRQSIITYKPFLEATSKVYQEIDEKAKRRNMSYLEGFFRKMYELGQEDTEIFRGNRTGDSEIDKRTATLQSFEKQFDQGTVTRNKSSFEQTIQREMKKKIGKLIEICSSQNYSDTKHLRTENGRGSTTDKQLAVHHLIETSVPFKLHFLENDLRTDPERYWKATKQLLDYWINNANENENIFPVSATDQQDFFMRNWFFNISETTKTIGNLILQADHPEKLLAPSLSAIHRNFNPFLVNLWSPHQIGQVPCPTSLHIQIHIPDDGSRPRFVQPYITDQTQFESTKEFWDNTDFYKADLTSWVDMERSNRKLISDQIRKYAWQSAEQIEIFLTDLENLWHRRTETFDGSHTRAFINHIEFVKKEKPNTGRRRSLGSLLDERIFNEEITSILHNTADAYAPWLEGELERIYRDNPLLEESRRPIGE